MKYKISQYYLFIVALFTLAMLYFDWVIGLRYMSFFLLNVIMLHFARKTHRVIMLIVLGTMFLSYFLRGFVVATDYNMFTFVHMYEIDREKVLWSFDTALIGSIAISFGLLLASFRWTRYRRTAQNKAPDPFLNRSFLLIMIVLFCMAMMKILLIKFGSVGLKGIAQTGPLAFLQALVPVDLPFVLIGLYLFKYGKVLNASKKLVLFFILLLFSYSVLLSGSKIFIMAFAMSYAIYLIFMNVKVRLLHFASLLVVGALLVTLSFGVSRAVKASFYLPHLTSSDVLHLSVKYWKENDALTSFSEVTARFNGFDGQLKYLGLQQEKEKDNLIKIKNSFSPMNIVLNVTEGLIPKVDLTDEFSCGVAVGRYAEKFDPTKPYAGALGLVAAGLIISKSLYFLVLFILGIAIGILTKAVNFIRHADLQFMFVYVVGYFSMLFVMSGNIDAVVLDLIIKSSILILLSHLLWHVSSVIQFVTSTVKQHNVTR